MARRWTKQAARILLDGVGSFGWSVLERRTGHTKVEIKEKIRRDFGGGGITRGSYSLAQAVEETNYSRSQLERAAKALNQRWQRTARGGNFLITAEQIEDMVVWLKEDFWSKKHHLYKCFDCGTADRPHKNGGLCTSCFRRTERVAKLLEVPWTPEGLLDFLQKVEVESDDQMFLEQMKVRLKAGRLPSTEHFERIMSLCS